MVSSSFHAAALRWKKNDLDILRRNLATMQAMSDKLDGQRQKIKAALKNEMAEGAEDILARFDVYAQKQRNDLSHIDAEQQKVEMAIASEREKISAAFEVYKPLERAAQNYQDMHRKAEADKVQAELDDRAATLSARHPA
jgi:hypothetical protein